MRNNYAGKSKLFLETEHEISEIIRHDGIDHGRRLVVENAFRLRRQGTRYGYGPLIPRREVRWIQILYMLEIYEPQKAIHHIFLVLLVVVLTQLQGKRNILADR